MLTMFTDGEAVAVIGDDGAVKEVTTIVRVSDAGECVQTADGRLWRNSTGVPRGGPRRDQGYLRRPDGRALLEDDIKRNGWAKEYADKMRFDRKYIERWDAAAGVAVTAMVDAAFGDEGRPA